MSNLLDDPNLSPQEIFKLKWLFFAQNGMRQILYLGFYSVLAYFVLFQLNVVEQFYSKVTWSILYAFLAYYIAIMTLRIVLEVQEEDRIISCEKHIKYAAIPCCFLPATFVYYCLLEKHVRTEIVLFRFDFYWQIEVTPMFAACSLTLLCIGLNNLWIYLRFANEKGITKIYLEQKNKKRPNSNSN